MPAANATPQHAHLGLRRPTGRPVCTRVTLVIRCHHRPCAAFALHSSLHLSCLASPTTSASRLLQAIIALLVPQHTATAAPGAAPATLPAILAVSSATSPRLVALVTDFACVLLEREGVILSLRDARTPDGHTLLTAAATVGAVRLTSALMGSDPLRTSTDFIFAHVAEGLTALHIAAARGDLELAQVTRNGR